MGKRLKPQAFFHNLLPSSYLLVQWSCRAGPAESNSKPNLAVVLAALEAGKKKQGCTDVDSVADVSNGRLPNCQVHPTELIAAERFTYLLNRQEEIQWQDVAAKSTMMTKES